MYHWDYRVIRRSREEAEDYYAIHQVSYEGGKIITITERPASLQGKNIAALQQVLGMIKEALEKPILDAETIFKLSNV